MTDWVKIKDKYSPKKSELPKVRRAGIKSEPEIEKYYSDIILMKDEEGIIKVGYYADCKSPRKWSGFRIHDWGYGPHGFCPVAWKPLEEIIRRPSEW